jgi:hypothetical protein
MKASFPEFRDMNKHKQTESLSGVSWLPIALINRSTE